MLRSEAVIDAARAYVREITHPVPDLAYRARLREQLTEAVERFETIARKRPDGGAS